MKRSREEEEQDLRRRKQKRSQTLKLVSSESFCFRMSAM